MPVCFDMVDKMSKRDAKQQTLLVKQKMHLQKNNNKKSRVAKFQKCFYNEPLTFTVTNQ